MGNQEGECSRILNSQSAQFDQQLEQLLAWEDISDPAVVAIVEDVLSAVKQRGDEAVLEYTNRFDRRQIDSIQATEIGQAQLQAALDSIPATERQALEYAAERVRTYHQKQLQESWSYRDESDNLLGQQVTPIAKVGVYVPGGKAAYPSSVLMNVIPAHVAGVEEIIMVSPAPDGEQNPLVLAAAAIAGVDRCFTLGGAQAVAALAYGTETVPKVDKIVGPGNVFVATAKRQVYGTVGIDMLAGPSEILVVSDGTAPADWIAMDLFSQAEHDETAQAILVTWDQQHLDEVQASIDRLLPEMERAEIIRQSLQDRGALILARDLADALELVNRIAPEHLELAIAEAESYLPSIKNAGAIFLGCYTAEAMGDYCAGPSHVLPTSTTARFSSPLGVYDFQKRSSVIGCSAEGSKRLGEIASVLARGESLTAHARSAEYRTKEN